MKTPGRKSSDKHNLAMVIIAFLAASFMSCLVLLPLACTDAGPDTSAPQRTVIDRSPDWQGALLYIADENGPVAGWGSVYVYDNVSGFVEKTVEQTAAASPVDVFVTRDGGSMYVAGANNGRIDKFRWDGNNWIRGGITIETPAQLITSLAPGPDGQLYITAADSNGSAVKIYRVNTAADSIEGKPLDFPQLSSLHGIAWSPDGSTVYLSGNGTDGQSRLAIASWPSLAIKGWVELPGSPRTNQVLVGADGRYVHVMTEGRIFKIDSISMALASASTPSGRPDTTYLDGALSADGRFMFVTGRTAGEDSSLYIIDLTNDAVVKTVKHMGDSAGGIQRVE